MKKFLVAILAFVYISTSMGATMHFHYCMGRLVSWGLVEHKGDTCNYCGMSKKAPSKHCITAKNSCCKDEHKQIKTEKDQKLVPTEFQNLKFSQDASAVYYLTLPKIRVSSLTLDHPTANAPPSIAKVPVFLLNCNFRI